MFEKGRIDVISLGCSKNLVDSERLMFKLQGKGYKTIHDPEIPSGEYVVINTCGFIGDAKEESVNMIVSAINLKESGEIGKIAVMGCLSERYMKELKKELPEVDYWFGKFDWSGFIDILPDKKIEKSENKDGEGRSLTTPPWSAYIKVSEGCNRFCAFCAIPLITGRHHSRKIEDILQEVEQLACSGVKEFNVIAQDLSSYGLDLYGEQRLPELIDRMAEIPGVEWIRLHYLYPSDFPTGILDVIKRRDNVCNYLDIALQHISDPVLKNMRRNITSYETKMLLNKIREEVPDIHLRTTMMVGFPGEGDEEFEELLAFVEEEEFERLGGFSYCEEENTFGAKNFKDIIPEEEKKERLDTLMEIQQGISYELNQKKIGKRFKVLVERYEGNLAIGRTEYDSPEVDQEVLIRGCTGAPGEFVTVEVVDALPFELLALQVEGVKK